MLFTSDESCLRVGDCVYYERLFSNSQSPMMDDEQVLPRFDPFEPFRSLLKNGVQFLKLDSLSKSFCFKGAMGKTKYALPFTFLMFISDHCQDCLKDEVRIQISL